MEFSSDDSLSEEEITPPPARFQASLLPMTDEVNVAFGRIMDAPFLKSRRGSALAKALAKISIAREHFSTGEKTKYGTIGNPDVEALRKMAKRAPFGQDGETRLDTDVRDAWQIPVDYDFCRFEITGLLEDALARVCPSIAYDEYEQVIYRKPSVTLYRIHIYEKGGHFKMHKDTPHGDNHLMSGVIVCGSPFAGGGLEVVAGGETCTLGVSGDGTGDEAVRVAVWYTDCDHRVLPVTDGTRVVIQFDVHTHDPKDIEDSDAANPTWSFPPNASWMAPETAWKASNRFQRSQKSGYEVLLNALRARGKRLQAFVLSRMYPLSAIQPRQLKLADRQLYYILTRELGYSVVFGTAEFVNRDVDSSERFPIDWVYIEVPGEHRRCIQEALTSRNPISVCPGILEHTEAEVLEKRNYQPYTGNEAMDGEYEYSYRVLIAIPEYDNPESPLKRARKE